MNREEAMEALIAAYERQEAPPPEAVEIFGAERCAEVIEEQKRLDSVLALDEAHEPRPGFDTKFFARLEEVRGERRSWFAGWKGISLGLLGTAVAAAALVVVLPEGVQEGAEETSAVELARDLDLLENYEMVASLDEVEVFDLLAELDSDRFNELVEEEVQ